MQTCLYETQCKTINGCRVNLVDATGLYKHFRDGCPNDTGMDKQTIRISLIDFMDTTPTKLREAGHRKGNCSCQECDKLRKLELKWILMLGTLCGGSGLNKRNILNSAVRVQF